MTERQTAYDAMFKRPVAPDTVFDIPEHLVASRLPVSEITAREIKKYQAIWDKKEYRQSPSPGNFLISRLPVLSWLDEYKVNSVLDAGCGQGQLLRHIKRHRPNISVNGLDIAENAIDSRLKDVFTVGSIWDESSYTQKFDAIFCVDVMEHIPTHLAWYSLIRLRDHAKKFVFLSICLKPDIMGEQLIDEHLHLTVRDAFWWMHKISMISMDVVFALLSENTFDILLTRNIAQ